MGTNDDELPPEVQAEVDKARNGEGDDDTPTVEIAPIPEPKPLSRRAQAEQERLAQIEAATKRAEAAEKVATELRDEWRKSREAELERSTRLETALSMLAQQRQHEPPPRKDEGPSDEEQLRRLRKERDAALTAGNVAEYNEANEEIGKLHARAAHKTETAALQAEVARLRQQPQPMQKPEWVTAIESQHGDVMIHPRGTATVAAFVQLGGGQVNPENLDKAFKRAREELQLTKRNDEKIEQKRAVLSGGPTNGIPKNGGGKSPKNVNMPAGWRETARRAGISEDDYKRSYIEMHPEAVVRD